MLGDNHGREAFAYLAIILMISSGAYFAYAGNRALDERKRGRDIRRLESLQLGSQDLELTIRSSMDGIFNDTFSYVERERLLNGSDQTLEGELESEMKGRIPRDLRSILRAYNGSHPGYMAYLEDIQVEVNPVYQSVQGVIPSTGDDPGDLIEIGRRCEILGVEAEIDVAYTLTDPEGKVSMKDGITTDHSKATLSAFVQSRTGRLEDALRCGELHRVAAYLLTYLSQQKASMGYGRPAGETVKYSPPLLTGQEITDVVDLSVALISKSHLISVDEGEMGKISSNISAWPTAGGQSLSLTEALNEAGEDFDPATLILLSAGFGSEENAPSLSDVLRPLLYSLSELIATRFLVYTGTWGDAMAAVGALKNAIEKAYSAFSESVSWLFGRDERDDGRDAVWSLFVDMLDRGGIDMDGDLELLSGPYEMMDQLTIGREFDIYLSEDIPQRRYWEDPDGNRFTEDQGVGDEDEFVGYKCDTYNVAAEFSLGPVEPRFERVSHGRDGKFTEELIKVLGEDDGESDTTYEDLVEEGSNIFRRSVDITVEALSGTIGDETWEDLYSGWGRDDHPNVSGREDPITRYLELNLDAVETFIGRSFSTLTDLLTGGEFPSLLDSYQGSVSSTIAYWLNDTYDRWTYSTDQIEGASVKAMLYFLDHCEVNVTNFERTGSALLTEEFVIFPPGGVGEIDWVLSQTDLLVEKSIGGGDDGIYHHYLFEASRVYQGIKNREVSTDPSDPGMYTVALIGGDTRGGSGVFKPIWEFGREEAIDSIMSCVGDQFEGLFESILDTYEVPCLRERMAKMSSSDHIDPDPWDLAEVDLGEFRISSEVERSCCSVTSVDGKGGVFNSDPEVLCAPYRSFYDVSFKSSYSIGYKASGDGYGSPVWDSVSVPVELEIRVEADTFWPMDVGTYVPTNNILDDTIDDLKRAAMSTLEDLNEVTSEYLGGTLGSFSELPPVLTEMVESGDVDPSEISRVLSNISMDVSGSVRECARGLIDKLIEKGLSATVGDLLDFFGVDEVSGNIRMGMLEVDLKGYTDALCGGGGLMLSIDGAMDSIGLSVHVELSRGDNDTVGFNSTLILDLGDFFVRAEVDPFMDSMPHMLSVEGFLDDLRLSLKFPDITQRRTAEISLGSAIGFTPTVFIPPIGLSATFDAGFQLNYILPSEMKPHLNEVMVVGGVLTKAEFFDPQTFGMNGYSLETLDGSGRLEESIRIEPEGDTHPLQDLEMEVETGFSIVLRDPSGIVMDDVEFDEVEDGWFSRDADGYGVWRWGEGSPGESNSEVGAFSFTSIIISMALDSIEEAWKEAEGLYGLSFDGLIHFVQRALDLFVERVLEAVSELVLDARMFLKIKVVLGAGASGGLGIELSFLAEGEAVAKLLEWVYENVKVFFSHITDPKGSGDYASFPIEIVELCHLEIALITEVETPSALSKFSPGADLPDEITLGVSGRMSLSLPLNLVGLYSGGWSLSLGVFIQGAPPAIVNLFYDLGSSGGEVDIWILRAEIWEE